jgi:hypothetical protein
MIPSTAHLIWIGKSMPWIHSLALRSALRRGGFRRVVLHHSDDLSTEPWWHRLLEQPGFEAHRLDPIAALERCGERAGSLIDLFRDLPDSRARANVLRMALLAAEGGVYLDTDTLTVRSFDELLERGGAFCGVERLVFPAWLSWSRTPRHYALALGRHLVRDGLRRVPNGWRWFRRIERFYPVAVNNAVFGAERGSAFVSELLERMLAVPRARRGVRYELGTTLLQQAVAEYRGTELVVHPPSVFYPLGPEISEHWFKRGDPRELGRIVSAETRVVHWYASVRTAGVAKAANPGYVEAHAGKQLFSALVAEVLA